MTVPTWGHTKIFVAEDPGQSIAEREAIRNLLFPQADNKRVVESVAAGARECADKSAPIAGWELAQCRTSDAALRDALLDYGWEPFAVSEAVVWFRRRVSRTRSATVEAPCPAGEFW